MRAVAETLLDHPPLTGGALGRLTTLERVLLDIDPELANEIQFFDRVLDVVDLRETPFHLPLGTRVSDHAPQNVSAHCRIALHLAHAIHELGDRAHRLLGRHAKGFKLLLDIAKVFRFDPEQAADLVGPADLLGELAPLLDLLGDLEAEQRDAARGAERAEPHHAERLVHFAGFAAYPLQDGDRFGVLFLELLGVPLARAFGQVLELALNLGRPGRHVVDQADGQAQLFAFRRHQLFVITCNPGAFHLAGAVQMQQHLVHRHVQEHVGRDVIMLGEPVANEDDLFLVAYQAANSGRKKPRIL